MNPINTHDGNILNFKRKLNLILNQKVRYVLNTSKYQLIEKILTFTFAI